MFRLLSISIMVTGLVVFFTLQPLVVYLAAQPLAEDQIQPTTIKVYKSPG